MAKAIGRAVALDDIAYVRNFGRLRQITTPVDPAQVTAAAIGADHEIGHRGDTAIGDDPNRLYAVYRAEKSRLAAEVFIDLGFARQPIIGQAGQLGEIGRASCREGGWPVG